MSPDVQALAQFKATGITVSMVNLDGAQVRKPGESQSDYMQQLAAAIRKNLPSAHSTVVGQDGKSNGYISQSDFETVLAAFGDSKEDADQVFASLDDNHDGSVSNAEWLRAVGGMASEPGSSTAQSLLKTMDRDGDGTVNTVEFSQFEDAMIAAQKTA